jgi:hypothetical protein
VIDLYYFALFFHLLKMRKGGGKKVSSKKRDLHVNVFYFKYLANSDLFLQLSEETKDKSEESLTKKQRKTKEAQLCLPIPR